MRKLILYGAVFLVLVLATGVLAGCGKTTNANTTTTTTTTTSPTTQPVTTTTQTASATTDVPDNGIPKIRHSLSGRSYCLSCHSTGFTNAPVVGESHAGRTNDQCMTCHVAN